MKGNKKNHFTLVFTWKDIPVRGLYWHHLYSSVIFLQHTAYKYKKNSYENFETYYSTFFFCDFVFDVHSAWMQDSRSKQHRIMILVIFIREMHGSNLDPNTIMNEYFVFFINPSGRFRIPKYWQHVYANWRQ